MECDTGPLDLGLSCGLSKIVVSEPLDHSNHIQLLPPEIISNIMDLSLPPFTCKSYKEHLKDPPQALQLCLVSRRWYQTALTTPQLWTAYTLYLKGDNKVPLEESLKLADRWLSRAGATLAVSLRILAQARGLQGQGGAVLALLEKYAMRLGQLDLRLTPASLRAIATRSRLSFPKIAYLFLKCTPPQSSADLSQSMHIINSDETLQNVTLTRVFLRFVSLPWQGVRELELRYFFMDEILTVCSYAQGLTHLVIRDIAPGDDEHPEPHGLICLDRLETLEYVGADSGEPSNRIQELIEKIVVPRLTSLRLLFYKTSDVLLSKVDRMLRRSSANLAALIIAGWTSNEEDLLEFWQRWVGISVISLGGSVEASKSNRPPLAGLDPIGVYGRGGYLWDQVDYFLPALGGGSF